MTEGQQLHQEFYDEPSQFSVHLQYSPQDLARTRILTNASTPVLTPTPGAGLTLEYQPRWLQFFGIIGFGAQAALYPFEPLLGSLWSWGGLVRYQAAFFSQQILVPTVAYHMDQIHYKLNGGSQSGRILNRGYQVGVWILLNAFDLQMARELHLNTGIQRSYLTVELRQDQSSATQGSTSGPLQFRGYSIHAGLRVEF